MMDSKKPSKDAVTVFCGGQFQHSLLWGVNQLIILLFLADTTSTMPSEPLLPVTQNAFFLLAQLDSQNLMSSCLNGQLFRSYFPAVMN